VVEAIGNEQRVAYGKDEKTIKIVTTSDGVHVALERLRTNDPTWAEVDFVYRSASHVVANAILSRLAVEEFLSALKCSQYLEAICLPLVPSILDELSPSQLVAIQDFFRSTNTLHTLLLSGASTQECAEHADIFLIPFCQNPKAKSIILNCAVKSSTLSSAYEHRRLHVAFFQRSTILGSAPACNTTNMMTTNTSCPVNGVSFLMAPGGVSDSWIHTHPSCERLSVLQIYTYTMSPQMTGWLATLLTTTKTLTNFLLVIQEFGCGLDGARCVTSNGQERAKREQMVPVFRALEKNTTLHALCLYLP